MKKKLMPFSSVTAVLLLVAVACSPGQGPEEGIKLMTFNIRYASADDGPNSWTHRRPLVADIVRDASPDVLAIQEGLDFQLEDLSEILGPYKKLGQHRNGGLSGEFSGLYVREDRVEAIDWGELWLSPTPDSVGSVGWDAALPRMAVWADLRLAGTDQILRVYGTHFDHRGTQARLESARLLLRRATGGPPAVFMGDFNASEGSEPIKNLLDQGFRSAVLAHNPGTQTGTFNGFEDPTGRRRIDHIFVHPDLRIEAGEILGASGATPWPSDHFPVTARVGFR